MNVNDQMTAQCLRQYLEREIFAGLEQGYKYTVPHV